jgi:uncharacterized protein
MLMEKRIETPVLNEAALQKPVVSVSMWSKRIIVYVVGMFLLALGVSFSIKSNLGVSPMNSLPYVISQVIGIDMGIITTLVFSSYVLMQIILLRREFRLKNLLQIVVASLFGTFVSLTNRLLSVPVPATYPMQLTFLAISLVLIGLGIMLYLVGDLVPQPPEGLVLAITRKTDKPFSAIKVIFDCTVVSSALMISFLTGNGMMGVREGTLVAAIGIGKIIGLFSRWFRPALMAFCYGKEKTSELIR